MVYELMKKFYLDKIEYLLAGGLAMNLYGLPRMTYDVDILVNLTESNLVKLNNTLKKLHYKPIIPEPIFKVLDPKIKEDWIKNKNMSAFSYFNKDNKFSTVDVVINHNLDFNQAFQNKTVFDSPDYKIYLINIKDLLKIKEFSNRAKDQEDVGRIQRLLKDKL